MIVAWRSVFAENEQPADAKKEALIIREGSGDVATSLGACLAFLGVYMRAVVPIRLAEQSRTPCGTRERRN